MVTGTVSKTLPSETLCKPSILMSSTKISDLANKAKNKTADNKNLFKILSLNH